MGVNLGFLSFNLCLTFFQLFPFEGKSCAPIYFHGFLTSFVVFANVRLFFEIPPTVRPLGRNFQRFGH